MERLVWLRVGRLVFISVITGLRVGGMVVHLSGAITGLRVGDMVWKSDRRFDWSGRWHHNRYRRPYQFTRG
jgi:hypothetical protein